MAWVCSFVLVLFLGCWLELLCLKDQFHGFTMRQLVDYTPLEFTDAVKRFVPSIRTVYLTQSEMIKKQNDIYTAPKIKETWRIRKLVRRRNQKGQYNISFFKVANEKKMINSWFVVIKKHEIQINKYRYNRVYKDGEAWLRCPACSQWFH